MTRTDTDRWQAVDLWFADHLLPADPAGEAALAAWTR